ncbi:unnamed protein product [Ilex paraguariensis]|uniref:Uncharacterized protein n=1 Tax=Ilex paraguariensis TaxID=185542 RepID=A0ABC8S254_9AQUA
MDIPGHRDGNPRGWGWRWYPYEDADLIFQAKVIEFSPWWRLLKQCLKFNKINIASQKVIYHPGRLQNMLREDTRKKKRYWWKEQRNSETGLLKTLNWTSSILTLEVRQ